MRGITERGIAERLRTNFGFGAGHFIFDGELQEAANAMDALGAAQRWWTEDVSPQALAIRIATLRVHRNLTEPLNDDENLEIDRILRRAEKALQKVAAR